ncbi:TPA: ParA family protein [Salmonella enterica subsp. salamae serovar 35:g,m,s,t:-]|nr:ParA family protein [Salmonella enterica subsp. salamae serovar 35:g,m,s,t:-]HCA3549711.1 ParA family protein [Salmonella enterica subsp. salamae serovar 35:g,m,s,t:-]
MAAKVIVICNQKGGIGKTFGTNEISANLQLAGFRVLVLDGDSTASMTGRTFRDGLPQEIIKRVGNGYEAGSANVSTLYLTPDVQPIVLEDGRHILGTTDNLNEINNRNTDCIYDFKDNFQPLREKYDYILIDSSPAWTNVMLANHLVADYVIIPTILELSSREGVEKHLGYVTRIKNRYNPDLKFLGVLVTQAVVSTYKKPMLEGRYASVDTENLMQILSILERFGYGPDSILEIVTQVSTKVKEAIELNLTIRQHDLRTPPTQQYIDVTNKIIGITQGN